MKHLIVFLFMFLSFGILAQEIEKETIKDADGSTTIVSSKEIGMYNGTKSAKANSYYVKAAAFSEEKDFKKSVKFYLKAINEDAEFVEAYDNLGRVYRVLGEYDKAIDSYKKSIKLYPKGKMAHQNIALVYSIKKDYDNAKHHYGELIKMSENNPEGYFGLANVYMSLSQFDDALENSLKALSIYEDRESYHLSDGYYLTGIIYYYKGNLEESKKYLIKAEEQGRKLHPDLRKEVFGESEEKEVSIRLDTEDDYIKSKDYVLGAISWLRENKMGEKQDERAANNAFLLKWVMGSPIVTIELSEKIVTFSDCSECLIAFLGGYTEYELTAKKSNKIEANHAGLKNVILTYTKNKDFLGTDKQLEKLVKMDEEGKLMDFVKKNL